MIIWSEFGMDTATIGKMAFILGVSKKTAEQPLPSFNIFTYNHLFLIEI